MLKWLIVLAPLAACAGAPEPKPPPGPSPAEKALLQAQLLAVDEVFYVNRADALFTGEQYEGCLEYLSEFALAAHPESSQLMELRALCLWEDERRSEAIEAADRAAALDPTRYRAQLLLGNWYYGRDFELSIRALEMYFEHRPESLADQDALPLLKLALGHLSTDNAPRAEELFTRVITRFANVPRWVLNANNGLCAAYVRSEKFERAVELCEQIVADPRKVDRKGSVWFNLAVASHHVGNDERALEAVDEFLRHRPDAPKGLKLREDIRAASSPEQEAQ